MRLGTRMGGCQPCHSEAPRPLNHCDERRVTSITRAGDDVIITLSDCTFFRAGLSVIDESVKKPTDVTEVTDKVKELEKFVSSLKESLVDINDSGNDFSFKAISKEFK